MKNRKKVRNTILSGCLGAVMLVSLCAFWIVPADAAEKTVAVNAKVYEFEDGSGYTFSSSSPVADASHLGTLKLYGALKESGDQSGFDSYEVGEGNVSFSFSFDTSVLNRAEEEWHIIDDGSKSVNGIALESKIENGAVILQSSLNGTVWMEDVVKTNALTANADFSKDINSYTTKYIQIQNGCFYRLIVAYEMERKTGEKDALFGLTSKDVTERKKVVELYSFYLHGPTTDNTPSGAPTGNQYRLGETVKVKKGTGYSTTMDMDQDDPHYGWKLGEFYVTGFTNRVDDTEDPDTPVFLKTVGDKITLWFDLQQDITCLNKNSRLSIDEDDSGYDKYFGVPKTNFRHGALIIRYTDYQNRSEDPVIYTDFLAANATTSADTKVVLFEEGDYEVSLDYKITDLKGINSHTYYRISFKFKVRNGNDMVYPFDTATGGELRNNDVTPNGFRIDLANSKYLKVEVKRSTLTVDSNGLVNLNPVSNAVSSDGKSYTGEGIYTISVSSDYTSEPTEKTVYVGTDPYMLALAKNKIDVNELNDHLKEGMTVADDGTIYLPAPGPEPEPDSDSHAGTPGDTPAENLGNTQTSAHTPTPTESGDPEENAPKDEAKPTINPVIIAIVAVAGCVIIVSVILICVLQKKRKAKREKEKEEEKEKNEEK